VVLTSKAGAQSIIFGSFRDSTMVVLRHKALFIPLVLHYFGGALTHVFGGFILDDCCNNFCRSLLNK
jgi:hypothetical protein